MRRSLSVLILLLLVSSSGSVVAQAVRRGRKTAHRTGADSAAKTPAPARAGESASSPSRKLVIGGAHAGLVGILEINADLSLEGPLIIQVSADGVAVPQRDGDASGRLQLPLSRKKQFSVASTSAPSPN